MKTQAPDKLIIYTDGGSRGNPGPAAIGVAFADAGGRVAKRHGQTIRRENNHDAE